MVDKLVCTIGLSVLLSGTQLDVRFVDTAAAQSWTQFEMNRADDQGRFLWTTAENWTKGLPTAELSVEIGDDHSGKALHCVIPSGVEVTCGNFELAEHARTQGTTLRIEKGAAFTILDDGVLSKDRECWCYVDGVLNCNTPKRSLRVGGPWGRPDEDEPASAHLVIGESGRVDATYVSVNTHQRADSSPSSPWGPQYYGRSTDSEFVVDGGKLNAREGLRMSTSDVERPAALRFRGKAEFASDRDSPHGVDIWCGVWEIDGGDAKIHVGDVEFWGNKFAGAVNAKTAEKLGAGVSVLKLTGDGVSTIHARQVSFVDAAILDVRELNVPPGKYTVIDGASLDKVKLELASGEDANKWSLALDREQGDVVLTRK